MIFRIGLAAFLFIILPIFRAAPAADPDPPQDQAKPSPQGVEAGLKKRREYLQKLEEYTQALRDEVKLQLADAVAGQHLATLRADREYRDARLAREVAEYQIKEYVQGIYLQDLALAEGAVKQAAENLEVARDRKRVIDRMVNKGLLYVDPSKVTSAMLGVQHAEFDEEQARMSLVVLNEYTKDKETRKREAAVASALALESEKKHILELERAKEKRLEDQAERFKVRSPEDHVLALLDDALRSESKVGDLISDARKIEAQVREKPDDNAKLAEQLKAKKDEANALMNRAKSGLLEAATLGEQVRALRAGLRDAEARLKNERELVDRLDREFGAKK